MIEPILNKVLSKYRELEQLQEEINELGRDAVRVFKAFETDDEYEKEEALEYLDCIQSYTTISLGL